MSRAILLFLAAGNIVFGVFIFAVPMTFYTSVPGVEMLGPFSVHFIRDAGLAYLAGGATLFWGALKFNRPVAIAGTIWVCLHALFHLQMWVSRGLPFDEVGIVNLIGLQLPAWLALFLATQIKGRS